MGRRRDAVAKTRVERLLKTDEFRRRISETAIAVAETGVAQVIGTTSPTYILEGASALSAERLAVAVPVRPDEARQNFSEIRALVRLESDMTFGLLIEGRVVAVLRRHPEYVPEAANRYRQIRDQLAAQQAMPSLADRVSALEESQNEILATLRAQAAPRSRRGRPPRVNSSASGDSVPPSDKE